MAAVTLSSDGHFVAGTQNVTFSDTLSKVYNSSTADTLTLPSGTSVSGTGTVSNLIPVGTSFTVTNIGSGTITWAAASGETISGTATLATNARAVAVRDTLTSWKVF